MRGRAYIPVKELEQKYRGLAIEDSMRNTAEALAREVGSDDKPIRRRSGSAQFPFELALGHHLNRMEIRYGALLEAAPDAILVVDQTGEIVFTTARVKGLFDYEPDALLGKSLATLIDGELVARMATDGAGVALAAFPADRDTPLECTGIRSDGSRFPVDVMMGGVESGEGVLLTVAVRNASARKTAEKHLRLAEAQATGLWEAVPEAIVVVNRRGRITTMNARAEALFDHQREHLVGQPVALIVDDELAERMGSDDPVRPGKPRYHGRRRDGSEFELSAEVSIFEGEVGHSILLAMRRIEGSGAFGLDGSEFSRRLFDAAPDAMVVIDPHGHIVLFNDQAKRRFGYHDEEIIGQPIERILPQGLSERLTGDTLLSAEAALALEIGTGIEVVGRKKDGERFPVEMMLASLETRDGSLTIATVRDISVRKVVERHITNAARRAEKAPQPTAPSRGTEDLQQFAYVAAHDLQEPLRMVASYTKLLGERYAGKLDADADEFIGFAADGAVRMQRLVADLLNYCRVGSDGLKLERCSSQDALDAALLNLKGAVAESGAVVTHSDLPQVDADPTQLSQLFQNLVGNAIKYRGEAIPEISVTASRGDDEWIFAISDNGIGIEPRHQERIFMMFQRLHSSDDYPGTGIGLAVCRKIAERHGGRVWVQSQLGKGATFFFALPDKSGP